MLQTLTCRMDLAAEYGADAAIFLHNIVYWTQKNKAEGQHYHDGRYWMYATMRGLAELYPLWSASQIKRLIAKLRAGGALLVGDYNADRQVRTLWYAPSDEILALYDDGMEGLSKRRNRKMDGTKPENARDEIGKCIKVQEETTENNTPIPPQGARRARRTKETADWKPERFEAFWTFYRTRCRGENRQGAIRAWDKLRPSEELIETMAQALVRQLESDEWRRGIGIPYASTWLGGRRWEDVAPSAPAETDGEEDPWDDVR